MDKNKGIFRKGGKKAPPPDDLFALGTKPRTEPTAAPSRKLPSVSSSSSLGSAPAAKRPSQFSSTAQPIKKPKLTACSSGSGGVAQLGRLSSLLQAYPYESLAKEVDPKKFVDAFTESNENDDSRQMTSLICGAIKHLRANRQNPNIAYYTGLLCTVRIRPTVFLNDIITEGLCVLLRREPSLTAKAKGNPAVAVLACCALMRIHEDSENWPDSFVKAYIEDALSERLWVDRKDCRPFVSNIQTAFHTKIPPRSLLTKEPLRPTTTDSPVPGGSGSPARVDDEDSLEEEAIKQETEELVSPRYSNQQAAIEDYVVDCVKEQIGTSTRQPSEAGHRNLLKLMLVTCGYEEVRSVASLRLEAWLQNAKLSRQAQDLLLGICLNCDQPSVDKDIIAHISRIRIKNKHLLTHYLMCIRELVSQHPGNMKLLMKVVVIGEFSTTAGLRNPNNMAILSTIFQHSPQTAALNLASIFQELLLIREDYLKPIRGLFREVVRQMRQDMDFEQFAKGLMSKCLEPKFADADTVTKDRMFFGLADLICLAQLTSVSPVVRDAVSSKKENKDIEALHSFQRLISVMQRDATWWLHMKVPDLYSPVSKEFTFTLRKVLFLESAESYHKVDSWPPEGDSLPLRLVSEVPLEEDTLLRLVLLGIPPERKIANTEAMEMVEFLIKRAASLPKDDLFKTLRVARLEFVDSLFKLTEYRKPDSIVLPANVKEPSLAVTGLYWKAWAVLLVVACYNPDTIGQECWTNYPIARRLMEMVMTNQVDFMAVADDVPKALQAERKLIVQEKEEILEFERHLAKQTLTESQSHLLNSVIKFHPRGPLRRPPSEVLEQIRTLNLHFRLGQMLCKSREPDFLMELIKKQGSAQSMPWLAELVENSEGSMHILPVQCLCEFLLNAHYSMGQSDKPALEASKQDELIGRLQALLHSPGTPITTVQEILNYFLQKLLVNSLSQRQQAAKGLGIALAKTHMDVSHFDLPEDDEDQSPSKMDSDQPEDDILVHLVGHQWLLQDLPKLPHYEAVIDDVAQVLLKACLTEIEPSVVTAYLVFLMNYSQKQPLESLEQIVMAVSRLLLERANMVNYLFPVEVAFPPDSIQDTLLCMMLQMYNRYYDMGVRHYEHTVKAVSQFPDLAVISWEQDNKGVQCVAPMACVHAAIALLAYTPPSDPAPHLTLLDNWFPLDTDYIKAYFVDTEQDVMLTPDWLKLRLIRSTNDRVVDIAVGDIEVPQVLLFVQSFGLPIRTISKLLLLLDEAAELNDPAFDQVEADKQYLWEMIHILHLRGAQGGQKFKDFLAKKMTSEQMAVKVDTSILPLVASQRPSPAGVVGPTTAQINSSNAEKYLGDGLGHSLEVMFNEALTYDVRQQTFKALLLAICSQSVEVVVVNLLHDLLMSSQGPMLVATMSKRFHWTCPILKAIAAKKPPGADFPALLQLLHNHLGSVSSALGTCVRSLMKEFKLTTEMTADPTTLQQIVASSSGDTQGQISKYLRGMVAEGSLQATTKEICCELLAFLSRHSQTSHTVGLLLDWLTLLDPEVMTQCPDLQSQLLLGRTETSSFQTYLMCLLVHQSHWGTLRKCVDIILSTKHSLNATQCLDLLWACLHIPRLWQGRDRKLPKNYQPEDLLELTPPQTHSLVGLVVSEAQENLPGQETLRAGRSAKMAARIPLILECCAGREELMQAIVDYLRISTGKNRTEMSLCDQLLMELYVKKPGILNRLPDGVHVFANLDITSKSSCELDVLTHRVISVLGAAAPGKKSEDRLYDANIALRKLASQHPLLLIRQLPLVAAILQGRASFTFGEMRHRNNLHLYAHILGVLELLPPWVFQEQYREALEGVLAAFFDLLQRHGGDLQLGSIATKFIKFLLTYQTCEPRLAYKVLQKYVGTLSDLTSVYPDFAPLRSILSGLSVPRTHTEEETLPQSGVQVSYPMTVRTSSPAPNIHVNRLLVKMTKDNDTEDVVSVLRDLDDFSKKKVDLLEYFVDEFKRLMLHTNENCRTLAFNLVMRHLRQSPSSSKSFVQTYLQCLGHRNPEIINSALRNLAEFALLAKDDAVKLLQKAFVVNIQNKADASKQLIDALQLLSMESMI